MALVVRNEVVTCKENAVGTGNLEEYALVLANGDVESLLVSLRQG